jgi:hypothetical protein
MAKKHRPLSLKRSTVRRLAPVQLARAAGGDEERPGLPIVTIIATGECKRTEGRDCGCGGGNDSKGLAG